jgi:hypothetical protein
MRPQDIAILLKIISVGGQSWQISGLAHSLYLSVSEVSESLNRSKIAGLIDHSKKHIMKLSLFEFLKHGVKYVFPVEPGALVSGIATAHSHPFMKEHFASETDYIWSDKSGEMIGQVLMPLYARQVEAVKQDEILYKLLALVDVIRVGRVREVSYAIEELSKILK